MSVLVAYDTLKIARRLADAGLDQKVAEGVSETFATVFSERKDALATKGDLVNVETRLEGKMDSVRNELRAEIKTANVEMIRWVIGANIALVGVLVAAIKLIH